MNIFVLALYFRLKILSEKCKFHYKLAFLKGEACSEMELHFARNMTIENTAVSSQYARSTT